MKVKVEITKQAGETGLRLPGTLVLLEEKLAKRLQKRKLVKIIVPEKPKAKKKPKSKAKTKK